MANLDDFFKKKDGKKKTKGKFSVSNLSLSNNTDIVKNGKLKQEKPTSYNTAVNSSINENDLFTSQNTDEWKDFVEEEKKDYSGLKIQNLQINDDDDDKPNTKHESEEETEIDEQGQTVVKKKAAGPWKIPEAKKEEVKPVKEPPKPVEPPQPSVYVPPSKRNQGFSRETSRTAKKADLTSEEMFPALGTTVPSDKKRLK